MSVIGTLRSLFAPENALRVKAKDSPVNFAQSGVARASREAAIMSATQITPCDMDQIVREEPILVVDEFKTQQDGAGVIYGWTIQGSGAAKPAEVGVRVNKQPLSVHAVDRPDVVAARPDTDPARISGFMAFLEPKPAVSAYEIEVSFAGLSNRSVVDLDAETMQQVAAGDAARKRHLDFLKNTLYCPSCHQGLRLDWITGQRYRCRCDSIFDCREGIDLIPENYPNKADIRFQGAICSHGYDGDVLRIINDVAARGGMVLDCGAGWRHTIHPNVITTEILRYPSTDVVAVGEKLPFGNAVFDAVLSLHVLEHVKNPFICAKELARVLKPGGTLFAVTPYIVPVHGYPFHFFNPTPAGLKALFEGMLDDTRTVVPRSAHAIFALKQLAQCFASNASSPESRDKLLDMTLREFVERDDLGNCFDLLKPEANDLLAGNFRIMGRKRAS
jgi:hypothetical protein